MSDAGNSSSKGSPGSTSKGSGKGRVKVGEKVGENLTNNQRQILSILSDAPHTSARTLAQEIGISVRKIEVNLRKLRERELLKRIGPARGGHWEVMENDA